MSNRAIPLVDLSKFTKGTEDERKAFVEKLGKAFHEIGFVGVVNHGISKELIDTFYKEAKEFLGIKDDDQYFNKPKKQYSKPDRKNLRKGDAHIEYLKTRKISEKTVKEYKLAQCVVWDHENKREVPGMAFPYLRGDDFDQVS